MESSRKDIFSTTLQIVSTEEGGYRCDLPDLLGGLPNIEPDRTYLSLSRAWHQVCVTAICSEDVPTNHDSQVRHEVYVNFVTCIFEQL